MRASIGREKAPIERLFEIALRHEGKSWPGSRGDSSAELYLAKDQADVDISDPAYDFVRSIHVFQIEYRRHRNKDGDCNTWSTIREGTYGEQGDFAWARSTPARVPSASAFRPGTICSDYWFRGVFVDWTDYTGTYGFEEVRY